MLTRIHMNVALTCVALLLAGCGSRAAPGPAPAKQATGTEKPAPDGVQLVTLHVEGMTQRLGLF